MLNAVVTSLLAFGVIAYKTATAALARREGSTSADVLANWFLLQPCHVRGSCDSEFTMGLGVLHWAWGHLLVPEVEGVHLLFQRVPSLDVGCGSGFGLC